MIGWTCRPCSNGRHSHCEWETNGVYCVCLEADCGEV